MSKADIVYILDSSGSEGAAVFDKMKDVIGNVTRMLLQDSLNVKFAAIKFSTAVTEEFRLDSFTDMNKILTAIHNITYSSGSSHSDKALLYAKLYSLTGNQGARPDSKKVAVVFSDGGTNNPTETVKQAKLLQSEAEVIAVGVGPMSSMNSPMMNAIASNNVTIALKANDIYKAVTNLLKDPTNPYC